MGKHLQMQSHSSKGGETMAKKNAQHINKRRAVYDLQNMLYTISRYQNGTPDVLPDGIFGTKTAQAISKFQQSVGIAPTGVADNETFRAISQKHREIEKLIAPATRIDFYRNINNQPLKKGDRHDSIYLAQIFFNRMSQDFPAYKKAGISGELDEITEKNLMLFQMANRIEQHGKIDRQTWERMALYYNMFCN